MSNVARKQRQCLYITLPKESSLNLLHTRLTITNTLYKDFILEVSEGTLKLYTELGAAPQQG